MKILVRFSKRTDCWGTISLSICNQTLSSCIRAALSSVMKAFTNHGKTSSADRNSGHKPKVSERDYCILKGTVLKSQNYCIKGDSRTQCSF
jgi:hypothetical protein